MKFTIISDLFGNSKKWNCNKKGAWHNTFYPSTPFFDRKLLFFLRNLMPLYASLCQFMPLHDNLMVTWLQLYTTWWQLNVTWWQLNVTWWQLMPLNVTWMSLNGNLMPVLYRKLMSLHGKLCHFKATYATSWQLMPLYGNLCHLMATYATLWQLNATLWQINAT